MLVLKPCVSRIYIEDLAFSPDGTILAALGWTRGVQVWRSLTNGAKAECVPVGIHSTTQVVFAPDGTLFAGYYELAAVDLAAGKSTKLPHEARSKLWFAVSPDGSRLIAAEQFPGASGCHIVCWAVGQYAKPLWETPLSGYVYSNPLFLSDGKRFVFNEHRRHGTPHWFGNLVTYSLDTGAELEVSACLYDTADTAILSPDGSRFACRTRETIRVYPVAASKRWDNVATIKNDTRKHFTGIAFHPSGRYLAATSNDATVKLYDTATWEVARTFTWDIGRMRSIAFSPDGTLAAAGSDTGKVVVWDVDL